MTTVLTLKTLHKKQIRINKINAVALIFYQRIKSNPSKVITADVYQSKTQT